MKERKKKKERERRKKEREEGREKQGNWVGQLVKHLTRFQLRS